MILNPLKNLKFLESDMRNKDWIITSFIFVYKTIEYVVLVNLFLKNSDKKNNYALVKLHFMKTSNLEYELEVEANINGLLCPAKIVRNYFNIEYKQNLGEILNQFSAHLGSFVPCTVNEQITQIQKVAMTRSLSKSDSEDPDKMYCYKVLRNPKGKKRSRYNEEKTKILRSDLFNYFKDDTSISFCYSEDYFLEKKTAEIIRNFAKK